MQLSEKEIEDYIFEDLTNNSGAALENRGLVTYHKSIINDTDIIPSCKWLRQLELGPYGRLDIVGYYRFFDTIHVELFELKANPIKVDDFEQICRYDHAIKEYLRRSFKRQVNIQIHKYLVGNGFESGHFMHNNLNIDVLEYSYDLAGISFKCHTDGWCRPDGKQFNFIKSLHHAEEIHGYR